MKLYLKNNLLSILCYSFFGILYNLIVYIFSNQAFNFKISYFSDLIIVIYYKIFETTENSDFIRFVFDNQTILMIPHGILSNFCFALLIGSSFTFLASKINDQVLRKSLFRRTLLFTIILTFSLAILMLLVFYIWALNNKDISWLPKERIFERYMPAIYMFEYRITYIWISFFVGIAYFNRLKKKPAYNSGYQL